jgi:DNA repair exonuclease SbcCD ATPase subunit
MNLKSLFMGNFGLFRGRLVEFGPAFNLIFGPNESGKTTLVDAIVISLLARTHKKGDIKSIPRPLAHLKNRYGIDISLQLVVVHDGKDLEFPSPENSQDQWDLGWNELRAIFIAREGDLELAPQGSREFRAWWESLKGKLLGFEEDPRNVLGKIAAEADLTDNLGLTVMQKTRRKEIQEKLGWFRENEDRIKALRELERDYRELQAKEKDWVLHVDQAEQGVLKSKLLKADEIYRRMKAAQESLREEYGRFTEKDVEEWKKLAQTSDKETAQVQWLRGQREKEETKRQETISRAAELSKRVNVLSEKLRAAAEREQELGEVAVEDRKWTGGPIPGWAPWASWAVAILALILGVDNNSLGLLLVGVALVILALALTYLLQKQGRKRSLFLQRRAGLIRWGQELGLEADSLPDLLKKKMDLQQEKDELEGKRKVLEEQLPQLDKAIDDLMRQEKVRMEEIEKVRERIRYLRDRVGLADLEELQKRIKAKLDLESDVDKKFKSGLRTLLGSDETRWPREIEKLKSMDDIRPVEDPGEVRKLHDELESCRQQQRESYQTLTRLVADLGAHFDCHRPEEAFWKVEDLEKELKELDILERAGQKVRETFGRVLQGSDTVLDDIFDGQTVRDSFSKITTGRYRRVAMDDLSLKITDRKGRQWDFSNLSSGTKDQLLTVLRLALAEQRLHGKGFFILDDPLVNSDRIRLREQMEILGQLVGDGWQVLFLTAQDEIRHEAEILMGRGIDVNFIDL